MCGIAGIVNFSGKPVEEEHLHRMNNLIEHRGPDGAGIFSRGNVGLAHRRLAIIDPAAGQQPIYNDDNSITLVYNGEVYNYVEIRRELEKDFNFRTHSDTEVVLRAYEKWGISCLERFRGMFAFALHDSRKNLVYIVRDRAGIKPLFYYRDNEKIVFCSELFPITSLDTVKKEIESENISLYLRYQYVPAPRTIYKNIFKLESGNYLEINTASGNVRNEKYWELQPEIVNKTESEYLEELNSILDEVVKIYVRSDVPFGAFLSGGIDSSIVTALMSKHMDQQVHTFSIGFNEKKHSELPFAAEVSRTLKTCHYEKNVTVNLAEPLLVDMQRHFGEPFGDSSAIPTYYVSNESASQVKMVLSGDGGDELFAGYNSYPVTFMDYMAAQTSGKSSLLDKLKFWRKPENRNLFEHHRKRYDQQRQGFDDEALRAFIRPEIKVEPSVPFTPDAKGEIDPVLFFQAQDFKTYMQDDVLTKVDRMSMANSLEVRVPLLDHKIIEMAFRLPLNLRLQQQKGGIRTKYLLKESAARFIPESILNRPKQGFGIPIIEWCQSPLRPLIEKELLDRQNEIFNWLDYDTVSKTVKNFYNGNVVFTVKIWYILIFSLWVKYIYGKNI